MKNLPAFPIKSVTPRVSRLLRPLSDHMLKLSPKTSYYLSITGVEMGASEYAAIGFLNAFLVAVVLFSVFMTISILEARSFLTFSLISSSLMFVFTIFYWIGYPIVYARRKAELIEKDLLFALRDISVEVSGGVSLKESIDSISYGYGELSAEMKRVSEEISFGKSIEDALEDSMKRSVSHIYKSVMIRIVDGLRTGIDISSLLSVVISSLGDDLKNKVKKYGQEINTWITLYLVIGIVMPSMGLTLMIMLSSFSGVTLTAQTFYLISGFLIFFHASALSMLKSRRPLVEI